MIFDKSGNVSYYTTFTQPTGWFGIVEVKKNNSNSIISLLSIIKRRVIKITRPIQIGLCIIKKTIIYRK